MLNKQYSWRSSLRIKFKKAVKNYWRHFNILIIEVEEEVNYLIELDDDKRKEYIIDLLNKLYTDSYCQIIFAKKIFF